MPGETESRPSGWTVDTLHAAFVRQLADLRTQLDERHATQTAHIDAAFTAAERAVQTALSSAEKAVAKAELSSDKRFDAVNEFRSQLRDQAATLMPRAEADARLAAFDARLAVLEKRADLSQGHTTGLASGWAVLVGVAALAGTIVGLVVALT